MKIFYFTIAPLFFLSFQFSSGSFKTYTQLINGSDISIKMVPITGGNFLMGSPDNEIGRKSDEGPMQDIQIDDFWMSTLEVSWDLYELFLYREIDNVPQSRGHLELNIDGISSATMPYLNLNKSGYPVTNITQYGASQFCKWLSATTGYFYRLPTEAEWEYACQAGTNGRYSFSLEDSNLENVAWFKGNSHLRVHKSGYKEPNPFGLFDMHGNVSEWVLDGYTKKGYSSKSHLRISKRLYPRVVRGGSFRDEPNELRSAARDYSRKSWKKQDPQSPKSLWWHTDAPHIGFRIIRPKVVPFKNDMKKFWIRPIEEY